MKKEKKSHGVQLLLRMVVKDPDGKVLSDTGQKPSKSFIIQFLELIGAFFDGVTTSATDTSGAASLIYHKDAYALYTIARAGAALNVSLYGVQVGTGDTPEDNEDHKLDTQLTEGVGAGNITHGATVIGVAAVVGPNVDVEIKRAFINNTGSTITVKEAGLAIRYGEPAVPVSLKYHLIIRDVLPASIDIPDRCGLAVYYTARTTV